MNNQEKKVVILQSTSRHYRVGFFSALYEQLSQEGIDLHVIYSDPNAQEAQKGDCVDLDGRVGMKVPARWLFSNHVIYQRAWRHVADADLVIVEHASKHLLNYGLFATRPLSQRKVALWGHGFSQSGTPLGDFLRHRMLRLPDWWFAYNARSMRYLLANGVPARITTNVQNAIDTDGLSRAAERVSWERISALRGELGMSQESRVGLFCGSLYSRKRLPMLISASALIRTSVPDFHLVIVGDGPDRHLIQEAAARYPWLHYAGTKFGDERAPYFRIADLVLNPGLVGLGILDAFAVGLPVLTTDIPTHSPEIEYLEDDNNGAFTPDDIFDYADAAIAILRNHDILQRLRRGAHRSGRKYTLGNMVNNFFAGVMACLERERTLARAWSPPPWFRVRDS